MIADFIASIRKIQNLETSSLGLAFMASVITAFGNVPSNSMTWIFMYI